MKQQLPSNATITTYTGRKGSGMSTISIWLAIAEHRGTGKKAFCRYHISSGKSTYLTSEDMEKELREALITEQGKNR